MSYLAKIAYALQKDIFVFGFDTYRPFRPLPYLWVTCDPVYRGCDPICDLRYGTYN